MSVRGGMRFQSLVVVALGWIGCVGSAPPAPTPDGGFAGSGGIPGIAGTDGGAGMGGLAGKGGSPGTDAAAGSSGGSDAGTAGAGGKGGTAGTDAGTLPGVAGTVARTLAYHQVSALTVAPTGRTMISSDGSRIAYAVAPGTGDPLKPNRIFVINPDGTGNLEVDSYKSNCYCGSQVAISGDGRTVVSSDATQIRVVGSDASKKGVINFDSKEISDIAISGDGSTAFMVQYRNNTITGGAAVERGVWSMNADASNHHQVVGPTAIAALVGATPDKVFPFAGCGKSLEVSANGQRVVLAVAVADLGQYVFAVDGTTPRKLVGPVQFIRQVAISSDGNKVAVGTQGPAGEEISVMGFDGSGSKVITTKPQGSCYSALSLNADGSQLLSSDTALLFPTAGGDPISLQLLTADDGVAAGGQWHEGAPAMSMAGNAKRFSYWNFDANNMLQIFLQEIDPVSAGAAPTVANPTFSVASIPRDRSVGAVVTAGVSGGGTLVRAGTAVLVHGVEDVAGSWVGGKFLMRDDGTKGDAKAGDGVFTSDGSVNAGMEAEVGPRQVRIKAESKGADGRLHATAIDVSGLAVK